MSRITYEERKEIYDKFRKERRNKIVATLLVGAVCVTATMLFMGCNTTPETSTSYGESEHRHPLRDFSNVPEDSFDDMEILVLNRLLNEHGILAFRMEPQNPEHQRRYRRHLEEPRGFHTMKETDI